MATIHFCKSSKRKQNQKELKSSFFMSFKNILVLGSKPSIFDHLFALDISNKPTKVYKHFASWNGAFLPRFYVCFHYCFCVSALDSHFLLALSSWETCSYSIRAHCWWLSSHAESHSLPDADVRDLWIFFLFIFGKLAFIGFHGGCYLTSKLLSSPCQFLAPSTVGVI